LRRGGVVSFWSAFQRRREDDEEGARERARTRGDSKKNTRRREEKNARATRWKTRGDLLLGLGVARVHLIYRTLRNAEGTTAKLNHYPSEAPALRRALRPRVASCNAPALRPYELRCVPTSCDVSLRVATCPYDVAMFLYDVATYLHDVLMLRTEGLDRFRGLPSYVRFGQSDRTQKRHGTPLNGHGRIWALLI